MVVGLAIEQAKKSPWVVGATNTSPGALLTDRRDIMCTESRNLKRCQPYQGRADDTPTW